MAEEAVFPGWVSPTGMTRQESFKGMKGDAVADADGAAALESVATLAIARHRCLINPGNYN